MENIEFKAKEDKRSRVSFLQKIPSKIKSPKILIYALLLISLPTSVLLVKTVQDIRQRASGFPATPPIPPVVGFGKALHFPLKRVNSPITAIQVRDDDTKTSELQLPRTNKSFTVEAWVKPELSLSDNPTDYNYLADFNSIVSKGAPYITEYRLNLNQFKDPDKNLNFEYFFMVGNRNEACNGGLSVFAYKKITASDFNQWRHIAAVYTELDNGAHGGTRAKVKLFENGKLLGEKEWTGTYNCGSIANGTDYEPDLFIGGRKQPKDYLKTQNSDQFQGEIDEVRISKTARYTEDFIPSNKEFEPDIDTVGLWHFNNNLSDSSSKYNHGTPTNSLVTFVDSTIKMDNINTSPTPTTSATPTPTCTPRPACLDAEPRCYIPELESYCPPTVTPIPGRTTPTPTPQTYTCGSPCSSNTQCSGICSTCTMGKCAIPPTPTYITTPTPTPAVNPTINPSPTPKKCEPTRTICASNNRLQTYKMDLNCTTATLVSSVQCKTTCVKISGTQAQCAENITPTPTPTPAMCPTKLSSSSLSSSCRTIATIISREKGYRRISYVCSDKYKGTINVNTCTTEKKLKEQASTACAKRISVCK